MKRNKYVNTFNTTSEFDNYIESAEPGFPNVALTKDTGDIHYIRTSPNDHVWYGEVVDATQSLPTISIDNVINTPTLYTLTNMLYLDRWSNTSPTSIRFVNGHKLKTIKKMQIDTSNITSMYNMFQGCSSLTSLDVSNFNTSNVTNMNGMFRSCSSLTSLDLSNFNTSNVTNIDYMFQSCRALTSLNLSNFNTSNVTNMNGMFTSCSSLTDVYITVEATLMKLTNNLTSQGSNYIPSNNGNCTIHYNNGSEVIDYKWQNNAWTAQS